MKVILQGCILSVIFSHIFAADLTECSTPAGQVTQPPQLSRLPFLPGSICKHPGSQELGVCLSSDTCFSNGKMLAKCRFNRVCCLLSSGKIYSENKNCSSRDELRSCPRAISGPGFSCNSVLLDLPGLCLTKQECLDSRGRIGDSCGGDNICCHPNEEECPSSDSLLPEPAPKPVHQSSSCKAGDESGYCLSHKECRNSSGEAMGFCDDDLLCCIKRYSCGSKINMTLDVVYFVSPDFPSPMSVSEKSTCEIAIFPGSSCPLLVQAHFINITKENNCSTDGLYIIVEADTAHKLQICGVYKHSFIGTIPDLAKEIRMGVEISEFKSANWIVEISRAPHCKERSEILPDISQLP